MKTRSLFVAGAIALLSLPVLAAPVTWTIDTAHSRAGFAVKHLLVSNVRGELGPISGTIVYDAADPSKSTVDATIDVKGVTTQNEKRDTHLHSADFFDTEKFPTATFKSTSVTKGADGKLTIVGNFTLRGVTKPVTLEVEGPAAEQAHPMMKGTFVTAFSAKTKLNRKDFGVSYGPNSVVSDDVAVDLDIEADRK